jgi:hypothetical protein
MRKQKQKHKERYRIFTELSKKNPLLSTMDVCRMMAKTDPKSSTALGIYKSIKKGKEESDD